jgi:hypothetical protein
VNLPHVPNKRGNLLRAGGERWHKRWWPSSRLSENVNDAILESAWVEVKHYRGFFAGFYRAFIKTQGEALKAVTTL